MKSEFDFNMLSKRSSVIKPSTTMLVDDQAKALVAAGEDVISFCAGEPDFPTPDIIKDKAIDIIKNGWTGYTSASGLMSLKEAICRKLKRDNNLNYAPEQIVVSNGAKHSIYNALQAIINEEDEVIIPNPFWVSYPEMVKLNGGKPVPVELDGDDGFAYHFERLEALVTDKTKAIIINSPNNPTGVVYSRETLQMIGEFACRHNLWIISDEVYEKLVYDGTHVSIAEISDEIKERTILVNGLSKAYSMTGWRIGYMAAPTEIAKVSGSIQSHSTSNPNTIAQHAAVTALDDAEEALTEYAEIFRKRRDLMLRELDLVKGVTVIRPQGAFYVMANISELYGKSYQGEIINDCWDFARMLLDTEKVATVPGSAFGDDRMIRMAYACSDERIIEGIRRMKEFTDALD